MPISFDWSAPLNASGVSPSDWNSNPPCTGRHAEMTLIHGPAGASSCPYRVPASCVASVSPAPCAAISGLLAIAAHRRRCVRRERLRTHGGHCAAWSQYTRSVGIRTRSVASAYTSPNTGTGPDRDTYSAVKLVCRQSGSERQWIDDHSNAGGSSSAAHTAQTNSMVRMQTAASGV
jgi:hypothetical protein